MPWLSPGNQIAVGFPPAQNLCANFSQVPGTKNVTIKPAHEATASSVKSNAENYYLISFTASIVPKSFPDGSTARATIATNPSFSSGYFAASALINAILSW